MTTRRWIVSLTLVGPLLSAALARDVYVSPDGRPDAEGTRSSPCDLASALEGRQRVGRGDTVYLLAGTYRRRPEAEYAIRLAGESHRPIHVRPAPGERVVIDGGLSFDAPCAHVQVWELEVLVSENFTLPREIDEPGSHPKTYGRPWGGVHLRGGKGCKLIHCVIHDCAQGVSAWSGAVDTEIYGCLIHENGWKAPDRGHGHAIYTQNKEGTKTIRDCILSAKYPGSYTLHAYGSSRAFVDNFLVERNIAHGLGPFLIGGGRPSRGIRVLGNSLHGVDLRLGYNAPYNEDCEVRDNIVIGGNLHITKYRRVKKEGNLVLPRGAERPQGIRVRWYPSQYLPRRAHLAVYDLSGRGGRMEIPWVPPVSGDQVGRPASRGFLVPGMKYRVFRARDVFGKPLSEGMSASGTLPVRLEGEFGAFVVERSPAVMPRSHGDWRVWDLTNGLIQVRVAPQVGGRVIQYRLGEKEFLWSHPELAGKAPPPGGLGPDETWLNYGGDKLWPAPQGWDNDEQWPGPPDAVLDGGPYECQVLEEGTAVRLVSGKDARSGIRFSRVIRVFEGSTRVSIGATMENIDTKPRRWGIWAHTQLDGGKADGSGHNPLMKAWCPLNPRSRHPGGYRVIFGSRENFSFVPDRDRNLMEVRYRYEVGKIGLDSAAGWVATVDGATGAVFVQRFDFEPDKEYPDESSVEFWLNGRGTIHAYNQDMVMPDGPPENPYVFESEVLSPYARLGPGESTTWHYDWYATNIGGDHPVVDCNDVGVISEPLASVETGDKRTLRGRFGVFCPGTLLLIALDADGREVGALPWSQVVSPLEAAVIDVEVVCPAGTTELSLALQDRSLRRLGELGRVVVSLDRS